MNLEKRFKTQYFTLALKYIYQKFLDLVTTDYLIASQIRSESVSEVSAEGLLTYIVISMTLV